MIWRDSAIALSLANLCFIGAWRWLLLPSYSFYYYHMKVPPSLAVYAALIFDVLLLATLFLIGAIIKRRSKSDLIRKSARLAFVLTLSVPIYGLLSQMDTPNLLTFVGDENVARKILATIPLATALFLSLVALLKVGKAVRVGIMLILILTPFVTGGLLVAFNMYSYARGAVRTAPLFALLFPERVDLGDLARRKHFSIFRIIHRQALEAATDTDLGLVMVHWPIPHPPNIYDRSEKTISAASGRSYLDNLELVDQTIGDLRRAMESKGIWENTVVLVTSDQWWRSSYWRNQSGWTTQDDVALRRDGPAGPVYSEDGRRSRGRHLHIAV